MSRYLALLGCVVAGCSSSSDYGPPTSDTEIALSEAGGFVPPGTNASGFHLIGTLASYTRGDGATGSAELSSDVVADMIVELEKVEFLDIGDLSNCKQVGADGPLATISADLTAGSNEVDYDTNCDLRDLSQLITRLFELSGFTTWASQ